MTAFTTVVAPLVRSNVAFTTVTNRQSALLIPMGHDGFALLLAHVLVYPPERRALVLAMRMATAPTTVVVRAGCAACRPTTTIGARLVRCRVFILHLQKKKAGVGRT
jgi:hypothetical protein